jgi:putative DNA primase/helicase
MTRHLTIERARGRWREILPLLGIETRFLRNRQGPCPLCGGTTRFRFDDLDGNGTFYCNHCGAGAGLHLVRKLKGWDFVTACREVDRIIGDRPAVPIRRHPNSWRQPIRDIHAVLEGATAPDVVTAYLSRRGLAGTSPVLLGHPACPYWDDGNLIGRFPAVIAPLVDHKGVPQSLHRIYDANVEPRKKTMKPVSTINGTAARLHDIVDEELGIAEGVETALAAFELFGIPTWATISDNGIATFVSPGGIRRLIVFGDNDANFVGQAAAYTLAKRLTREGLTVEVRIPPVPGRDWLDVLTGQPS